MRRVYIDANVILRFLTGDPPEMAAQARALFEIVERGNVILIVDAIIVAETVWVLKSFYGYANREIVPILSELLSHDGLEIDDKPALLAALGLFAEKNIDFADALVAIHMGQREIAEIFSFDRHFDRLPGIVRLSPGEELEE